MKKITYLLAVAALASMVMVGCTKKDDTTAASVLTGTPAFTASIDGTAYTATTIKAFIDSYGFLEIRAASGKQGMEVLLTSAALTKGTGTYLADSTFGNGAGGGLSYLTDTTNTSAGYQAQSGGVIVVTAYDATKKTISGTFNFTGIGTGGSKKITAGIFSNISFSGASSGSITGIGATIAGVAFAPTFTSASSSSGEILIEGILTTSSSLLSIQIPTNAVAGSNTLNATNALSYDIIYEASSAPSDSYSTSQTISKSSGLGSAGNITITKNDTTNKVVTGTFAVTVTNSTGTAKAITGGTFTGIYK